MVNFKFDPRRPPNVRQAEAWKRRLRRVAVMAGSVEHARAAFEQASRSPRRGNPHHLRLRPGFVYRTEPVPEESSDRRVPPREDRPPATRVASSRGAALRLELTALALAQARHRSGARGRNELPLRPPNRTTNGWTDLLATEARPQGRGLTRATVTDKQMRALQTALKTLERAGLVDLPNRQQPRGFAEGFELLDEEGPRSGTPLPYAVPPSPKASAQQLVQLPWSFITQGWVHVLEDSEITLLLMVACGRGGLSGEDGIAIPADVRLLNYGISRDAFASHALLHRLGLIDVVEINRHADGRVIDHAEHGAKLHRLEVLPEGFAQDAREVLQKTIIEQLARLPRSPGTIARARMRPPPQDRAEVSCDGALIGRRAGPPGAAEGGDPRGPSPGCSP